MVPYQLFLYHGIPWYTKIGALVLFCEDERENVVEEAKAKATARGKERAAEKRNGGETPIMQNYHCKRS